MKVSKRLRSVFFKNPASKKDADRLDKLLNRRLKESEARLRDVLKSEVRAHSVKILNHDLAPTYYWERAYKKIDIETSIDGFADIARQIKQDGRTFLDLDRLYTLWQCLASLRGQKLTTPVVEIGVHRGGSLRFMALAMKQLDITGQLVGVDTFEGHAVVDNQVDGAHAVGDLFTSKDLVLEYLHDIENVQIIQGDVMTLGATLDGLKDVPMVHIDVDVHAPTSFCLELFGTKVMRGGTIVVDDYGFTTCPGAKKAVDEFCTGNVDYFKMHLLTGQAVLIRCTPT